VRVLIADDDALCRKMLEDMLTRLGYEVLPVADGAEAWRILQMENAPRLAILDWLMPGMDGVDICRELRRKPQDLYTYVLLLTARDTKEDAIAGLDAGADDYLIKPLDASELRARLRTGMRILDLQEHLISGRENLRVQATHDPLTGLYNRAEILDVLQRELARCERGGGCVAALLADLDHFKEINDTYGHLIGDAVLRELSLRMRSAVRPYDAVGRYGGDEFLLVLPGCDASAALSVGERIRISCARKAIETSAGPLYLTLSLGGTIGRVLGENQVEPVLLAADTALYRAKKAGRNRVVVQATDGQTQDAHAPSTAARS